MTFAILIDDIFGLQNLQAKLFQGYLFHYSLSNDFRHFDRRNIGSQNLQAKFCSKDFRQENQQANKQII